MNKKETNAETQTEALPFAKLAVGRSFSSTIDRYVKNRESKFQVQYIDYEQDQWTVPVLLTSTRAINLKNDNSIKNVRILWRSVSFEIQP